MEMEWHCGGKKQNISHFKYFLLNRNLILLCCRYPGVSEDPRTTKAAQTKGQLRPPGSESHRAPGAHRQVGESLRRKQIKMKLKKLKFFKIKLKNISIIWHDTLCYITVVFFEGAHFSSSPKPQIVFRMGYYMFHPSDGLTFMWPHHLCGGYFPDELRPILVCIQFSLQEQEKQRLQALLKNHGIKF